MKKYLLSTILTCAIATNASAAGYQLQEYSVTGLGRAFAGVGVMGDDYSAIAFNPAGMSVVEKSGLQTGLIATDIRGSVRGTSQPKGYPFPKTGKTNSRIFRVMPNFFGQYKVNNKLDLGLGLYVPFGLANDYKNDWFGTEHGQYSGITVVNLTPSISYKLLDTLAIGAGINLQYTVAHLTGGIVGGGSTNMHDADDFGVGYNIGLVFTPFEKTRFGLSYRSKVDHKLQGKNKGNSGATGYTFLDGEHKVNAKITTPETVIFSASQGIGDKWTISGTARWTRWSRFDRLNIYQENYPIPGQPLSSTNENWRNTWLLGAGVDYKACENLTLRFGSAWDNTAVRSAKYRTPRIPDERRIWVSVGASYTKNNWQIDAGYSHLFVHNAKAQGTADNSGTFNGKYRIKSDIFGIGVQYKF